MSTSVPWKAGHRKRLLTPTLLAACATARHPQPSNAEAAPQTSTLSGLRPTKLDGKSLLEDTNKHTHTCIHNTHTTHTIL